MAKEDASPEFKLMLTTLQLDALESEVEVPECIGRIINTRPRSRVNVRISEVDLRSLSRSIEESMSTVKGDSRKKLKAVETKVGKLLATIAEDEYDFFELTSLILTKAVELRDSRGDTPYEQETFLRRRIEKLITEIAEGRLRFSQEIPIQEIAEIEKELSQLERNNRGSLELNSCGPLVRFLANSIRVVDNATGVASAEPQEKLSGKAIPEIQRDFFSILDDFIYQASGHRHDDFENVDMFQDFLRSNATAVAHRGQIAFSDTFTSLGNFYSTHHQDLYRQAKQLGGVKLVLGGSSNFSSTHLDCVRKTLLYADTILIPDPILPWIEVEREHEQFSRVHPLRNAFNLLKLKPLVDAELPVPAVCVFPSWEKSLENNDEITKDGISQILLDFYSFFLNSSFYDESEIIEFAQSKSNEFLSQVESHSLFVAPNGRVGEPIARSIGKYRDYISQFRTQEFATAIESVPDSILVFNAIWERLAPQFHLRENAETMLAHPLIGIPSQSHYFSLCAKVNRHRLADQKILKPSTVNTLESINQNENIWLGNVPIESLVELRAENQNLEFRKRLDGFLTEIHEAAAEDLDRVSAEVSRGLELLVSEHQVEVRQIQDKFSKRHTKTMVGAWVCLAAQYLPMLGPLAPLLAVPQIGSYIWDKREEKFDHQKAMKSLVGVLATARSTEK